MAGVLRFVPANLDRVRFATLATPLANVGDGAWTMAILVKLASTGAFHGLSYLLATNVVKAGASFKSDDTAVFDGGSASGGASTFTSTASPYLLVLSKAAGTVAPTLSWKLGSGGAWTDETWTGTVPDQAACNQLDVGTWQGGGDLLDGWVGVVGWWEGDMSLTNKKTLDDNWRTSDWWLNAHGQPKFLCEFNVAAASLVDLAANATGLAVTGAPAVDGAETLGSWSFDGTAATSVGLRPDYSRFPKPLLARSAA
jgi:hypothetical protein